MRIKFLAYLCIDLLLIGIATVGALALRENLVVRAENLEALSLYLAISLTVAACSLTWSGADHAIWRLSTMHDYLRLVAVAPMITVVSVATCFALNRLDGVARAVPVLQTLLMLALLMGARLAAQLRHRLRAQPRQLSATLPAQAQDVVLLVGLSRLTELYLHCATEFGGERVLIAGVLGRYDRNVGRALGAVPVLGETEELASIVPELQTHGLSVDRIIVTIPVERLSPTTLAQLDEASSQWGIEVQYIAEILGLQTQQRLSLPAPQEALAFSFHASQLESVANRHYWKLKRALDVFGAAVLLVITGPLFLACSVLVYFDLGAPIIFWQRRPGLGGRSFHLCKFRTMRVPPLTEQGYCQRDEARVTLAGSFMRRTRLDELPQLYNILVGNMSFVGPRPLLPIDQAPEHRARLMVRPGLTGWAQIRGGRNISQDDKTALDIWYVQNASLWLDLKILLQTVPVILFGERIARSDIQQAWNDLRRTGVCRVDHDGKDALRARL